ncbi:MAG: PAS domain-containing sensor histidine kinase [Bacteroidota bacterium]|nr:PAS domain-containing sensor histidine kinase [Candidatus Kapabacteria bacterium]MDW8219642.1 PAS domain-containing sensor histidine kinase [Bacteroidota bacterium]
MKELPKPSISMREPEVNKTPAHLQSVQEYSLLNLLPLPAHHDTLQQLLLCMNDAVIVIDQHSRIVLFNRAAEKIFGYTAASVLQKPLEFLMPERYRAHHARHVSNFYQNGITNRAIGGYGMKLYAVRSSGEEFPVEISVAKVHVLDQCYSIAVVRDISERERYQQRIEEFNQMLESRVIESTQHLIRLNHEKTELLAVLAHDLRNPLASIIGAADVMEIYSRRLLLEQIQIEKLLTITQTIRQAAAHMTTILEEVLDVPSLEHNEENFAAIVETKMIEQICDVYRSRAVAKNITVHMCIEPDAPTALYGNSHAVLRVVDNLLSNAVKYSPIGGAVWVTVSKRVAPENQIWIRIAVRDSGPGIHHDEQEKLFQKFTRLSAQPTAGESSIGLGLWITKQLVDKMRGTIWCNSTPGQGAEFIVELLAAHDVHRQVQSVII